MLVFVDYVTATDDTVQIHQNPDWPSKDVEVLVSADGITYQPLARGVVPATAAAGPNYAYYLHSAARAVFAPVVDEVQPLPWPVVAATHVKVRILSGYRPEYWGLGEIEMFGSGAVMQTDDDWYDVNADITGLTAGRTYHYRVVAVNDQGTAYGEDRTFTVPATATTPEVITGPASRIRASTAKVEGRLNPLGGVFGERSVFYFEYGVNTSYGASTEPAYGGLEISPRTYGADATFIAK